MRKGLYFLQLLSHYTFFGDISALQYDFPPNFVVDKSDMRIVMIVIVVGFHPMKVLSLHLQDRRPIVDHQTPFLPLDLATNELW